MPKVIQATLKNTRELLTANKASGTVTTLGSLMQITSGEAIAADSGTVLVDFLGICNETISVADALTRVDFIKPDTDDTFIIATSNATNAAHNNQQMILASATEANNTGTTNAAGIVVQVEPYGASGDKLIIAKFLTL